MKSLRLSEQQYSALKKTVSARTVGYQPVGGGEHPLPPRTVPFLADIEWLLTESNFIKVIEGKFNRDAIQEAA